MCWRHLGACVVRSGIPINCKLYRQFFSRTNGKPTGKNRRQRRDFCRKRLIWLQLFADTDAANGKTGAAERENFRSNGKNRDIIVGSDRGARRNQHGAL
jgi:hypothetical protein